MSIILKKNFNRYSDDPWVEVAVPPLAGKEKDVLSFPRSTIIHFQGYGDSHSSLKLQSGAEYFFSISHDELKQKIYNAETTIDLREVTVFETKENLRKKLQEDFQRAASLKKMENIASLQFTAYVRESKKDKFVLHDFHGKEITGLDGNNSWLCEGGSIVNLYLADKKGGPFGSGDLVLENMTLKQFNEICEEAVKEGRKELDLSERTRYEPPQKKLPDDFHP